MENERLDAVRAGALNAIDESKRHAVRFLIAAGVFEGVLMISILFLIDIKDRLQLLVFFCACLVYGTLAFGLFALKAYIDMSTLRVLRAVELVSEGAGTDDAA